MNIETLPMLIYWAILYTIIFYGVNELITKSKMGSYALIFITILFAPLLIQTEFNGWFNIFKFFTLLIGFLYLNIVRFKFHNKWTLAILAFTFHINIFEALLKDVETLHFINVVTGILLILIIPFPSKLKAEKARNGLPIQISYPLQWPAIIIYTLWHMCFIYSYQSGRGFQGDYILLNVACLSIPLGVAYFRSPKYWLQARYYTLFFNVLLIESTIVRNPEFWPLTPQLYYNTIYNFAAVTILVISLIYIAYMIRKQKHYLTHTILGYIFNLDQQPKN